MNNDTHFVIFDNRIQIDPKCQNLRTKGNSIFFIEISYPKIQELTRETVLKNKLEIMLKHQYFSKFKFLKNSSNFEFKNNDLMIKSGNKNWVIKAWVKITYPNIQS